MSDAAALDTATPADLSGRRALVIGAETVVGEAIARALGEAGADVALAVLRPDEGVLTARKLQRELRAQGRQAMTYAMDVTLGRNVQVTTRQVAKEFGGLDLVVSAPDELFLAPLAKTSDSQLAHTMTLNGYAHAFAVRSAFDEFRRGESGLFVLVTHALGVRAHEGAAAYSMACAAALALLRTLVAEHADGASAAAALLRGARLLEAEARPSADLGAAIGEADVAEAPALGRLACALAVAQPAAVSGRVLSAADTTIASAGR